MWFLDFRTQDVGGPVASSPMLYENDRWRGTGLMAVPMSDRGVTFVVHGYNVSRQSGITQIEGFVAAAMSQVPALKDSVFVGVLWPGDAIVGFLSYPTEEDDADRTAAGLAAVLETAEMLPPPSLVAHSLGCRVALQTIDILARTRPDRAWADQVVLLAAAVDDDALARTDRYVHGVRSVVRLSSVASTADLVLRFAFPAGDWIAGIFSGGYTRRALGYRGPAVSPQPPAQGRWFQVGGLNVGHGDYLGGNSDLRNRASAFAGHAIQHDEPLKY